MRVLLLLLLLLASLSACGRNLPPEVTRLFGGDGESEPDRLAIAEAESAEDDGEGDQVRLAIGSRVASAALIQQQGNRRMWRAPGGVVVATDGARVVATAGLRQIVMATRFDGPDPLEDPRALLDRSVEARRLVDFAGASRSPESMRFGVAFDCRLRGARTEEGLILVEERCRVRNFPPVTNRFWANAETGRVGFAEQWVGPGMATLRLDFEP